MYIITFIEKNKFDRMLFMFIKKRSEIVEEMLLALHARNSNFHFSL